MALKTLMLQRQLEEAEGKVTALREAAAALQTREAEIEAAMNEAETAEEKAAVEAEIDRYDADSTANAEALREAEAAVSELKNKLAEAEARSAAPAAAPNTAQKGFAMPETRAFFGLNAEARAAFLADAEVRSFLSRFRELGKQGRSISGAELTFPTTVLDLVRAETARLSKLLPFVRVRRVGGEGRQPIMGDIPEAIWTEMCANLNELEFGFYQVTTDGFKLGGYIAICNWALQDSDANLAAEIITALASSRAKAIDKAILFGKGGSFKMPLGIVTRLAQESQPESWGANAPTWTDLHSTNILQLNLGSTSGAEFFATLAASLAVAAPVYSAEGLFWVMNRRTHMDIMAKALAFNTSGALVAGMSDSFPIVGGTIVEMENDEIQNYEIIGGYGDNYLWVDRGGEAVGQSDQVFWLAEQTAFKHTARHDGLPLAGEAFVVLNYNNTAAEISKAFPVDYANAPLNILTLTAAAGTASGDTVVTVGNMVDSSNNSLKYKAKATMAGIKTGDKVTGFTSLTSGTTQITAAAGVQIAVVELDTAGRVVSAGQVTSVPKT